MLHLSRPSPEPLDATSQTLKPQRSIAVRCVSEPAAIKLESWLLVPAVVPFMLVTRAYHYCMQRRFVCQNRSLMNAWPPVRFFFLLRSTNHETADRCR